MIINIKLLSQNSDSFRVKTAPKVGKVSIQILEKLVLTVADAVKHQLGSESMLVCS